MPQSTAGAEGLDAGGSEPPVLELFYFDGCPNHTTFLPHLQRLLADTGVDAPVRLVPVDTHEDAQRRRFLGSPSLRVNGQDVDPGAAGRSDYGLQCRVYSTPAGLTGAPPDEWVLAAVRPATGGQ